MKYLILVMELAQRPILKRLSTLFVALGIITTISLNAQVSLTGVLLSDEEPVIYANVSLLLSLIHI